MLTQGSAYVDTGHGGILDRFDGIFFIVILQNLRLLLWPQ